MPLRPCLGVHGQPCNRLTLDRRCPTCAAELARRREATRPDRHARGLGSTHTRLAAQAIAQAEAAGTGCARCGHPGTPDNPLTGDHITPRAKGGRSVPENYVALCRSCNSAKGAR